MPKQQKTSTREFKLEAVQLVKSSGKPMSQIYGIPHIWYTLNRTNTYCLSYIPGAKYTTHSHPDLSNTLQAKAIIH